MIFGYLKHVRREFMLLFKHKGKYTKYLRCAWRTRYANGSRWVAREVERDFWRNNLVLGVTRSRVDYNTDGYLLIRSLKYQEQFAARVEYK